MFLVKPKIIAWGFYVVCAAVVSYAAYTWSPKGFLPDIWSGLKTFEKRIYIYFLAVLCAHIIVNGWALAKDKALFVIGSSLLIICGLGVAAWVLLTFVVL